MSWKSALARGLGFVRGNDARSRDLQAEIRSHIELETDENIERGLDPVEARRAAFLKFGNPQLAQESSQAMWSVPTLESMKVRSVARGSGAGVTAGERAAGVADGATRAPPQAARKRATVGRSARMRR